MPFVSIIIPCFNEEATIFNLLEAISAQTFPKANLEVIIADGMSTDHTREQISVFAGSHPGLAIKVVDNAKRAIPAGLNSALKETRGDIIVRLDAHSMPYPDYIERCVADLEAGLGENVGGVWEIRPGTESWVARSIAHAGSHPLGVGDALYRHSDKPALVDTVPFGAFKREILALVGFFDETLLTNEDYEFNARIRKSGGRIWLDPSIRSIYFARPTFSKLATQYFRYGFWKWRMLRRYPETLRWRQGLPPLFRGKFILFCSLELFSTNFSSLVGCRDCALHYPSWLPQGFSRTKAPGISHLLFGLPLAIATMHLSWGAGFLWSMIKGVDTSTFPENG